MTLADVEFNLREPIADQDEIFRCLRTLLMTPAGSVPLDRNFGINQTALGYPMEAAQSMLAAEIMEKVMKYEPRVSVPEVEFTATPEGQLIAKVVLTNA